MVIDRINAFIEEKGIKQSKICEISSLNQPKLSLSLQKKRKLSPDELAALLGALRSIVPGTDINYFFDISSE